MNKIIWAVDPFSKNKDLQRSAALTISKITDGMPTVIEPVYLLNTSIFPGSPPLSKKTIEQIKKASQTNLEAILKGTKIQGVRKIHVLAAPYLYQRESVEHFVELAKRRKANLILTSTHLQKGLKFPGMGGFAETLLLHSDVPLLFVNTQQKKIAPSKSILFPTDFSETSKKAFGEVLKLAQVTQSKITLLHWPVRPSLHSHGLSVVVDPIYQKAFNDEVDWSSKEANDWQQRARLQDVQTEVKFDFKKLGTLAEAILKQAKAARGRYSMIAMAAQSSPLRTTLLGSTTRRIVREATLPVWVLHCPDESSLKPPIFNFSQKDVDSDLHMS